ncbi:hypothetical protein LSPH24S_09111 [Lysinibacillus sphaericus]
MSRANKLSNKIILISLMTLVALLIGFIVTTIYTAKSSVNKTIGVTGSSGSRKHCKTVKCG